MMGVPDFGSTSTLPPQWPENAWMEAKQRWLAVLAPVDLEAQSKAQHASPQEEREKTIPESYTSN